MATAGDGNAPYESDKATEEFWKSSFRPDINEEPQNVSQEAEQNVLEEEIASCTEIVKAFKRRTISTGLTPRQDPATMEYVPDELLLNIFIHLRAKQLFQMRSVSKSWNALLSEPSFVKSHLDHSIHNNDRILMIFYDKDATSSDFKPFTLHPCQSPELKLTNFIKLPINPQSEYKGIKVIGSVNGLICSSYDNNSVIHIWNPSLASMLTLPPSSVLSPEVIHRFGPTQIYFRFGFDPKTDDYKVVKITVLGGVYNHKWCPRVEIYSMRMGSWEFITERFPSDITWIWDHDSICVDGHDGHLHWMGANMKSWVEYSKTIVAFDLGSETFCDIPLPLSILDRNHTKDIGVLARNLCVMSWDCAMDGGCEVWVMEEYGVAEWVKRHVFSQFLSDTLQFGFTTHNEFLFLDRKGRLVLYDPDANKTKIVENYRPNVPVKFVEYVESLVWVAPREREIVAGARQI